MALSNKSDFMRCFQQVILYDFAGPRGMALAFEKKRTAVQYCTLYSTVFPVVMCNIPEDFLQCWNFRTAYGG